MLADMFDEPLGMSILRLVKAQHLKGDSGSDSERASLQSDEAPAYSNAPNLSPVTPSTHSGDVA
jgi:hypothetical protein